MDGVFIVDEPELHLHRAIQARLWDAVEITRPDCTFVYITHDLGFAASRKDATKVWLREYVDGKWDWEEVPDTEAFPESMLLEVIGSRQPILFVEGDRGSLDHFVYGKIFPHHTIVPCGSCEVVVHSVRSFTQMAGLHHNTCQGLVDNDGRSQTDIEMLKGLNVEVLPVAQVENLFLLEPVLQIAAEKLGRDPAQTIATVKSRLFDLLTKRRVAVVSNLARQEIETRLRLIGTGTEGAEALAATFAAAIAEIDPAAFFKKWDTEIARVLTEQDYPAALRYCKGHGIAVETAGPVFGLNYQAQIMRWLRTKDSEPFLVALRAVLLAAQTISVTGVARVAG